MQQADAPVDGDSLIRPGATLRRLMGLWRPRGRLARHLDRLLAGLTLACNSFLVVCVLLKLCADPPTELEQIALCSLVTTICTGFLLKAVLFMAQGGTLRRCVRLLAAARARLCSGDRSQATRRRYTRLSNTIHFYGQVVALPGIVGWVVCPLLSHGAATASDGRPEARPHRQLPGPVWLPVDVSASPTYEILYAVQSVSVLVTAECCVCINLFFVHMMLMVAAELEVLNENISAMGNISLQTKSSKTEKRISKYKIRGRGVALFNGGQSPGEETLTENAAHEWLHRQLVDNVLHHQAIIRSVSLLQSAMNVSIFILLFINMANLCSSLFVAAVLLQRDGNVGKAMNALFSIPGLLYETTIYCIYAHIMTDQSERLMYSAFSCGWVNSDTRFKRSLMIFMMVTVRPIEITVGKTCRLSKEMLLQVMNGTYALLNMLYYLQSSK